MAQTPDNHARHGSHPRPIAPQAGHRATAVGDGDQNDGEPETEESLLGDFTDGDLFASEVSKTEGFCNSYLTLHWVTKFGA
jgi:hypothetical protein